MIKFGRLLMESSFIEWLPHNPFLAVAVSLLCSILIAIAGLLPSVFITVGNILYFGFWPGLLVSIIGEAVGAIISFILYRKGLLKLKEKRSFENKLTKRLRQTNNFEGAILVIALRIFPFAPSGVVTFTAALSSMNLTSFALASTFGKIPSLYIEALSTQAFFHLKTEWQLFIFTLSLLLMALYFQLKRRKTK